jgi:hypothetical protein
MSEFGRRAVSNNSYGSDHGTVAPLFIIGSQVNPGLIGQNPNLKKVPEFGGNLSDRKEDIIDYRIIFNTIVQEWFGLKQEDAEKIFPSLSTTPSADLFNPDITDKIPLFKKESNIDQGGRIALKITACSPNPVTTHTQIEFYTNHAGLAELILSDSHGKIIKKLSQNTPKEGFHVFNLDMENLPAGIYYFTIVNGNSKLRNKLVKL